MESLETLRRRLGTAETLGSLVSTMKALAAVSIRQYEQAARSLRHYAETVEQGLQVVLREGGMAAAAVAASTGADGAGSGEHLGAVVFGSSQGLAGRFNDEVTRLAAGRVRQLSPRRLTLLAAGPFAAERLEMQGLAPSGEIRLPGSVAAIAGSVQELLVTLERWRHREGVDRILLIHNLHSSGARFSPHTRTLLPLDPAWLRELAGRPWGGPTLPAHRAGRDDLLAALVREHLFVACYRAFAESLASEHASRLAAMQAAEKNVDERIDELRDVYHRRRQSAITEELMDITAGALAVRGELG